MFHQFIFGRNFQILTDSLPAKMIFQGKEIPNTAAPRLQRWSLFLSSYDYQIIYTKKLEVTDLFMPRIPMTDETGDSKLSMEYVSMIVEEPLLKSQVVEGTIKDQVLQQVLQWMQMG